MHLHGKDVDLARLLTDLTQHIRKPGEDVKKYAVFNKPEVVVVLRGWVAAAGDFGGCARGAWLLDQLNALIRARPSNSQCAERAVQAAHQSSGKGYDTKGTEALTSRKVAVLHEMREVFKIAGRASRQAKEEASLVALAVRARAAAKAAAAASYAGGGGARGDDATGAAAAARGAAEAMELEAALEYEVTYVRGDDPLGVVLADAAAGVVVHSLSALPAGEHTTTARSAGIAAGDVLLSVGDVLVVGFEVAQAVATLGAVPELTAVQVRFRRAPGAAGAGAAGAADAAALQTPARGEAAEQTGMVTEETEPEVDLEDEGGGDPEKALERATALAQEDEGDDPEELASTGWLGTGFQHKRTVRVRLAASALTQAGIVTVLKKIGEKAAQLRDPGFRARVAENAAAAVAAEADLAGMEVALRKKNEKKEKDAKDEREANPRKATFGDKERAELAKAPKSQVLVPQTATDEWNLDGATKTQTGGELTRERAARELEARALDVRRTGPETVRPGEVHPSESLKLMIARLKEANGGNPLMKKMTDEDGDLKTGGAMDWNVTPGGGASSSLAPPPRAPAADVTHMEEADQAAAAAGGEAGSASPGSTPGSKRRKGSRRRPPLPPDSPSRKNAVAALHLRRAQGES